MGLIISIFLNFMGEVSDILEEIFEPFEDCDDILEEVIRRIILALNANLMEGVVDLFFILVCVLTVALLWISSTNTSLNQELSLHDHHSTEEE